MGTVTRPILLGLLAISISAPFSIPTALAEGEGDSTIQMIFRGRQGAKVKKEEDKPTVDAAGDLSITLAPSPTPSPSISAAAVPFGPATSGEACEPDAAVLAQWVADQQSKGAKYCGVAKSCKNCCGEENRQDKYKAFCGSVGGDFSSTVRSAEVCEGNGGTAYIYEWIDKAQAAGKTGCSHSKLCANCCGPDNTLDRFVAFCGSLDATTNAVTKAAGDGGTGISDSVEACETDGFNFDGWLSERAARGLTCSRAKSCTNCCGEGTRFDKYKATCGSANTNFAGNRSDEVCEGNGGANYIQEWLTKARAAGKTGCTSQKMCANCCGPGNTLDKFVAFCN